MAARKSEHGTEIHFRIHSVFRAKTTVVQGNARGARRRRRAGDADARPNRPQDQGGRIDGRAGTIGAATTKPPGAVTGWPAWRVRGNLSPSRNTRRGYRAGGNQGAPAAPLAAGAGNAGHHRLPPARHPRRGRANSRRDHRRRDADLRSAAWSRPSAAPKSWAIP